MSAKPTHPVEKIEKPWGYELLWAKTEQYVGKVLVIRSGESLSLQYHKVKEETLFLEEGECTIEVGADGGGFESITLRPGDAFHVPPGLIHRMNAVTNCRLFEVSTPHLDDVVRLQDRYGRTERK